jgi:hypothetical protein
LRIFSSWPSRGEPPKFALNFRHGAIDGGLVSHVEHHHARIDALSTQSVHRFLPARFVPAADENGDALLAKLPRGFESNALVGARNQGNTLR